MDVNKMTVEVNAKELGELIAAYESERFRAICGWKNYEELKESCHKAGFNPNYTFNPKVEIEKLKAERDDLKKQLESERESFAELKRRLTQKVAG